METAVTVTGITHTCSRIKRDTIHEIEKRIQKQWADLKIVEANASTDTTDK